MKDKKDPLSSFKEIVGKHGIYVAVILIAGLLGLLPLLKPGLYTAHDIWHQVARLFYYSEALKNGNILPTWIFTLAGGYGYPLFYFSYHLPWLIGAPLMWVNFGFEAVLKCVFSIAFVASGLSFYAVSVNLWRNKWAALTGAMVYMWSPWHFLSMYVSASIGTVFGFVFLPLVVAGVIKISRSSFRTGLLLVSSGLAGMILSHMMTAVMIIPFVLLMGMMLMGKQMWMKWWVAVSGIVLALLLTSFYVGPLMVYTPFTKAAAQNADLGLLYERHLVNFQQLIYSSWGFGPIISNAKDGEISFQIGLAQWLAVGSLTAWWLIKKAGSGRGIDSRMFVSLMITFVIVCLAMTDVSRPVWKQISQVLIVDYPFRLMMLAVLLGSLTAVVLVAALNNRYVRAIVGGCLIGLALFANRNHVRVNQYTDVPLDLYLSSELTTNTFNEYLPYTARDAVIGQEYVPVRGSNLEVVVFENTTRGWRASVVAEKEVRVSLGQFGFAGMRVWVNEEKVEYGIDRMGLMSVDLSEGESNIRIERRKEPFEVLYYGMSLLAGLVWLQLWRVKVWRT